LRKTLDKDGGHKFKRELRSIGKKISDSLAQMDKNDTRNGQCKCCRFWFCNKFHPDADKGNNT